MLDVNYQMAFIVKYQMALKQDRILDNRTGNQIEEDRRIMVPLYHKYTFYTKPTDCAGTNKTKTLFPLSVNTSIKKKTCTLPAHHQTADKQCNRKDMWVLNHFWR